MINISVVIPTYNRPILLNRAIRSVLRQKDNHISIEVVVIDDCSLEKVNLSEFLFKGVAQGGDAPVIFQFIQRGLRRVAEPGDTGGVLGARALMRFLRAAAHEFGQQLRFAE